NFKKILADIHTPVGIYLRLRDRFRDTVLLESTDFHAGENSYSFIGINAIAGIEISNTSEVEYKLPGLNPDKMAISNRIEVPNMIWDFMHKFEVDDSSKKPMNAALRLYGYAAYDAVQFFDTIDLSTETKQQSHEIPLMRYRLYQYVLAINHFKDELLIC